MLLNCGVGEDSFFFLEKTHESPLDSKEIKPVNPKENQSWIFNGRWGWCWSWYVHWCLAPVFWPPDAKNWITRKDPDAGKDWRQEEKRTTEDEMVGWHHQLDRHEFEQAPGVGDGQGSLACYSPWGHKESDKNDWTELSYYLHLQSQHTLRSSYGQWYDW